MYGTTKTLLTYISPAVRHSRPDVPEVHRLVNANKSKVSRDIIVAYDSMAGESFAIRLTDMSAVDV